MKHSYIIIDDNPESAQRTQAVMASFQGMELAGIATNYDDALDAVLEFTPSLIFLEIEPEDSTSMLSLNLINELHRYLHNVPQVIVTASTARQSLDAIKFGVLDYIVKPINTAELRKAILRYKKLTETSNHIPDDLQHVDFVDKTQHIENLVAKTSEERFEIEQLPSPIVENPNATKPLVICVKSYGDYRFINAADISYLQADNNSTDIHLQNGEMITAFKTLKHFEGVLSSPFVRIHNSYIVNIEYVARIHTGNAVCHIRNTTIKLPFSKSYKDNVDSMISSIVNGNYLEI